MAAGTLRTWLSLTAGACIVGAVTLSADEPAGPDPEQTKALASLTAPAAPDSFAVAQHSFTPAPVPDATCVREIDAQMQPLAVTFAPDRSEVSADATPMLRYIADLIISCDAGHLQIAGHASSNGDDPTNLAVSWERADATVAALVTLGVDPAKLEAIGYGARQPIAQGDNDDNDLNRRVEFRVIPRRQ